MTTPDEEYIPLDVQKLAKLASAREDQVVKAGTALFTALTSGAATTAKITASAAKQGALSERQMGIILTAIAEGFRRPKAGAVSLSGRLGAAGKMMGTRVTDTVDTVRNQIGEIDLAEVKNRATKHGEDAIRNVSGAFQDFDFENIQDKAKSIGESIKEKATNTFGSSSESSKPNNKHPDNKQ